MESKISNMNSADTFVIERRNNLSYEDFKKEYLNPRIPVIISDATSSWEANSWTPEWFKKRYPGKILQTDKGKMTMEEFIDNITLVSDEPGPFLRELPLKDVFPDLMKHVNINLKYARPNWLGGKFIIPDVTRRLNRESYIEVNFCGRRIFPYLHIDDLGVHTFINQHYGDKDFVVYSPDQTEFLYQKPGERFSEIYDVDNPDLVKYPLFAKAKPIRVKLLPGECVFMPSGWWHTTRVNGTSLATVISIANESNWPDLIQIIKDELKQRRRYRPIAGLYSLYLKSIGFIKSKLN